MIRHRFTVIGIVALPAPLHFQVQEGWSCTQIMAANMQRGSPSGTRSAWLGEISPMHIDMRARGSLKQYSFTDTSFIVYASRQLLGAAANLTGRCYASAGARPDAPKATRLGACHGNVLWVVQSLRHAVQSGTHAR